MTGRSFTVCPDGTQRRAMESAGFVDIQERDIQVSKLATSAMKASFSHLPSP